MDEVIRLDSNQGSYDTSGNKSIVDIDIPSGMGVLDLSRSYVSVRVICNAGVLKDAAGTGDAAAGAVLNKTVSLTLDPSAATLAQIAFPETSVLVKNASLHSQNRGKLEDIRKVDMLRNTLSVYRNNIAEQTHDLGKINSMNKSSCFKTSEYVELSKVGATPSREYPFKDINIPLKQIFNCCKTDSYSTDMYGNTRLHLEMNFNKLKPHMPVINYAAILAEDETGVYMGDFSPVQATADAQAIVLITTKHKYMNRINIPYYVGMPLQLSSKNNSQAAVLKTDLKVNIITHNADGSVSLTLSGTLSTLATSGQQLTEIKAIAFGVDGNTTDQSVSIERVQLVAYVNNSGSAPPQALQYTTFLSNEDNYPVATTANRMYQIPEACKNVYVMFFSNGVRSNEKNLDKYRFTIDNKEQTPTAIKVDSPKHFDLISQVFMNNGEKLHSILQREFTVESGREQADLPDSNGKSEQGLRTRFIGLPVPFVNANQNLQIELEGTGNLTGHHIVYFEVARQK